MLYVSLKIVLLYLFLCLYFSAILSAPWLSFFQCISLSLRFLFLYITSISLSVLSICSYISPYSFLSLMSLFLCSDRLSAKMTLRLSFCVLTFFLSLCYYVSPSLFRPLRPSFCALTSFLPNCDSVSSFSSLSATPPVIQSVSLSFFCLFLLLPVSTPCQSFANHSICDKSISHSSYLILYSLPLSSS